MAKARQLAVITGALLLAVTHACASDPADPNVPPTPVSPPDAGTPSDASSDVEAGPLRAPFGLDVRPANPTCVARARPASTADIALVEAFPALPALPNVAGIYQPPGDTTRWFAITLEGRIFSFPNTPAAAVLTPVLDLGPKVHVDLEGGLLGFAFHPDWATNRTAFIAYTTGPDGFPNAINESRIARIKSNDGGSTFDPASEVTILSLARSFYGHNGGNLVFGPDGFLYAGTGDDGVANDPDDNGQRLDTLFGKMLRIGVGPTGTYTIPPDNPFATSPTNRKEIFAWGLRNPWRYSFDRASGALWVGDVGQNQWEEIDVVQKGGNYGWRLREGAHCRPPEAPPCDGDGTLIDPVAEYEHPFGFNGLGSITGGYVYRGSAIPELVGSYVFADFALNTLSVLEENAATGARTIRKLLDTPSSIASFAEDAAGELYALYLIEGRIMKIAKSTATSTNPMPAKLSQTGCFDPIDPKKPALGLVPYDVIAPFWSDGAEKRRWLALPDGKDATVSASGHLDLPVGAVVAKEFRLGGKRIETRLFVRHDDGEWAGYSYAWNDAETDATLLPSAASRKVGAQEWSFPSRGECMTCHTQAAGRTLGLEVGQLRRDVVYEATNRISPQLDTLEHLGLVKGAVASTAPALVDPLGAGALEARARSYLHANCSHCHQPGTAGRARMDLRFTTPLKDTATCNVAPLLGAFGIPDGKLVAPGSASKSLVVHRASTTSAYRMPPIARNVVDDKGVAVLAAWIGALPSCPP